MFQPVPLFIGWRYARSRKGSRFLSFITLFSVGGIALGVMALITVLSVMNGFEDQLKQRILGAFPHVLIEKQQSANEWRQQQPDFESLPRVTGSTLLNMSDAMVQSQSHLQAVKLQGIDPAQELQQGQVGQYMVRGQLDQLKGGDYSVILGTALAYRLGVTVGDRIRLLSAQRSVYTPLGRVPNQRKFTVIGLFEMRSEVDLNVALVHRSDAAKLLRYPPQQVQSLRLYLDDPFAASGVRKQLAAQLDPSYQVSDWGKDYGELFAAVKMEKNMMWMMLSLIIAVAAFNIVSALVIMVTDKQTDIAILSTMGLDRNRISLVFILQGVSNGVIGTVTGLGAGLLLTFGLNDLLSLLGVSALSNPVDPSAGLPIILDPAQIVSVLGGALVITFVATLYPSYKAARINPAQALKYE